MKAVKKTVRHYWKRQATTETTLTADGTIGGSTCAASSSSVYSGYNAYKAFDGNSTTWTQPSSRINNLTLTYYTPTAIPVTAVVLYFGTDANEAFPSGNIQASNDNSTWVTLGSFSGNTTTQVTIQSNDTTTKYKYIRFVASSYAIGSGYYGRVYEMIINTYNVISGTSTDYDFYTDDDEYLLPKKTVRHYWKYVEEDWEQPVLTSNTSYGTLSAPAGSAGSSFPAYYAFDNNLADASRYESTAIPSLMVWTLPVEIKVTSIDFYNKYGSATTQQLQLFADSGKTKELTSVIYPSTTAKSLTTISIPEANQQYSNQFVVNFIYGGVSGNYRFVGCQEIYIHAKTTTIIAGTAEDYDFYTDDTEYYGINQ